MKPQVLDLDFYPKKESTMKEDARNGDELIDMIYEHVLHNQDFGRLNHLIKLNRAVFRWSPVSFCTEDEENIQRERVRGNVHAIVDYLNQSGYIANPLVEASTCDKCGCVEGFVYGIFVTRR